MNALLKEFLSHQVIGTAATLTIYILFTVLVRLMLRRSRLEPTQRLRVRRVCTTLGLIAVALALWSIWAESVRDLLVALTAFTVAFVIASKELILCFLGWIYKTLAGTHHTGDRIHVGSIRGDVILAGFLSSTLLEVDVASDQSTGRVLILPHSMLLTNAVANETKGDGFRWLEIPIQLERAEDIDLARHILETGAAPVHQEVSQSIRRRVVELQEEFPVRTCSLEPKVYLSVHEEKPVLTLRIAVPPRQVRDMEDRILTGFFKEFLAARHTQSVQGGDTTMLPKAVKKIGIQR